MIPIYICDDEETMLTTIQETICDYIAKKNYAMGMVQGFSSPDDLLASLTSGKSGALYFLDVDLKHTRLDGFLLGEQIRKLDPRGFIVYITAFSNFAYKTFQHHIEAMDYIVKENTEKIQAGIARCLDTVMKRVYEGNSGFKEEYYVIKLPGAIKSIRLSDIYHFETTPTPHHIMLYAENEVVDYLGSMQEIESCLGTNFIRIHRAYIINIDKVESYSYNKLTVVMENGKSCFVARKMKNKLLQALQAKKCSARILQ